MEMDIDDSPRLLKCEARACAFDDNDEDLDMCLEKEILQDSI